MNVMRNIIFFTLITLLVSCTNQFERMPDDMVNKEYVEKAMKFANEFYNALKNGNVYEFANEAIEEIKKKLTPEFQRDVYSQVQEKYGHFQRLEYAEAWSGKKFQYYEIIRFKGYFERSEEPLEIRVVFNKNGKIAGFWIKPWNDELK